MVEELLRDLSSTVEDFGPKVDLLGVIGYFGADLLGIVDSFLLGTIGIGDFGIDLLGTIKGFKVDLSSYIEGYCIENPFVGKRFQDIDS